MSIVVLVDNRQCTYAINHLSLGGLMTIIDTPTAMEAEVGEARSAWGKCVRGAILNVKETTNRPWYLC